MEPVVRSPRTESAITDRAQNGGFGLPRLPYSRLPKGIGRGNPGAGNGIFGCRDGRLRIGLRDRKYHQRPKERNDTGEYPRRNGLFGADPEICGLEGLDGGRTRARTWDPMIKSHLLVDVAARQYELPHRRPSRRWIVTLQLRAAVVIKPVSDNSLRKTGIFAERAGDFRRFPPQDRRTGSPETNRMREKPVFA